MATPADTVSAAITSAAMAHPEVNTRVGTIITMQRRIAQLERRNVEIAAGLRANPELAGEAKTNAAEIATLKAHQRQLATEAALYVPSF